MGAVCQGSGLAADITNARIATLRIRRDYTDALDFAVVTLKRPKGFAPLDPLGVPLPHGTEVTARVPRMLGERRVPKGVVGRVVKVHDEGSVDVAIIGYGVLTYEREQVRARKPGQVRFAQRRAADWDALRPCAILEATVGSRA